MFQNISIFFFLGTFHSVLGTICIFWVFLLFKIKFYHPTFLYVPKTIFNFESITISSPFVWEFTFANIKMYSWVVLFWNSIILNIIVKIDFNLDTRFIFLSSNRLHHFVFSLWTCGSMQPQGRAEVKMAMGQIRIGWSLRAPKTETRNRNPNPNPKLIRVEIHHQNQTRGYPKPEWIPETRG